MSKVLKLLMQADLHPMELSENWTPGAMVRQGTEGEK